MMLRDLVKLIGGKEVLISPNYVGTDEFMIRRSVLFAVDNQRILQEKDRRMIKNLLDTKHDVVRTCDKTILARLPTEWWLYLRGEDEGLITHYRCPYEDSFKVPTKYVNEVYCKRLWGHPSSDFVVNNLVYKHLLLRRY